MNKSFELRNMSELIDIVRNSFTKMNEEGLIDDGVLVKTVMYCNEKLGIPIKEIKEAAIHVEDYKGNLPLDFDKVYYIAGLNCTNTRSEITNPFDNNIDQDVVYKACIDKETIACKEQCRIVVERKGVPITYYHNQWTPLSMGKSSFGFCHTDCPNKSKPGKYQVEIKDGKLHTPFRSGIVYIIYIGLMEDEEGNVLYPFHPLITPYYEWSIKEEILSNAIFNSDGSNLGELYKLAQSNRVKAYIDAFNYTIDDQSFGNYKKKQRERELGWYSKWFRYFQ